MVVNEAKTDHFRSLKFPLTSGLELAGLTIDGLKDSNAAPDPRFFSKSLGCDARTKLWTAKLEESSSHDLETILSDEGWFTNELQSDWLDMRDRMSKKERREEETSLVAMLENWMLDFPSGPDFSSDHALHSSSNSFQRGCDRFPKPALSQNERLAPTPQKRLPQSRLSRTSRCRRRRDLHKATTSGKARDVVHPRILAPKEELSFH